MEGGAQIGTEWAGTLGLFMVFCVGWGASLRALPRMVMPSRVMGAGNGVRMLAEMIMVLHTEGTRTPSPRVGRGGGQPMVFVQSVFLGRFWDPYAAWPSPHRNMFGHTCTCHCATL